MRIPGLDRYLMAAIEASRYTLCAKNKECTVPVIGERIHVSGCSYPPRGLDLCGVT